MFSGPKPSPQRKLGSHENRAIARDPSFRWDDGFGADDRLEHRAEKWVPVFRKKRCDNK